MEIVTLSPIPHQVLTVGLGGLQCEITLRQMNTGLYFDMTANGTVFAKTVLCQDHVGLVSRKYLGFPGDLFFFDTLGSKDPEFSGLGDRYLLAYVEG